MIAVNFPKVPVPGLVESMIGDCMPVPVLQAEVDAESAAREVLRLRPSFGSALLCIEDQADRESALGRLAAANKLLAAHNPGLILTSRGAA